MSDEFIVDPNGQVENPVSQVAEEPQEDWRAKYEAAEQRANSIDGRLRQVNDGLAASGYAFDPNANAVVPRGGYQPQNTPPSEELEDFAYMSPEDQQAYIDARATATAQNIINQTMGQFMPILESSADMQARQRHTDWDSIKEDALKEAQATFGVASLAQLQTQPKVFDMIVDAVRGKRASAFNSIDAMRAELDRRERANAGTSIGSSGRSQGQASSLTDDEREWAKAHNFSDEQFEEFRDGAVKIKFGGSK